MKILVLDIETAPHTVFSWGLWGVNIPIGNIVAPGYTLSWCAKFLDEDVYYSSDVFNHDTDEMYNNIHRLLEEADGVVTYYGDRFDIPQLNRGFVEWGFPRPSPFSKIDLCKVVKKHFKFASNKLDYVCQALDLGKKAPHKGMQLWIDCMAGDKDAWKLMRAYNKQDVTITEALYHRLLPWIDGHPNYGLHHPGALETSCPKCGSNHIQKRGLKHTQTQSYQQYQCQDCHSWFRDRFTAVDAVERKMIFAEAK